MSIKRNWSKINKNLVKRGSIDIFFDKNCLSNWSPRFGTRVRGGQKQYSDGAIWLAYILRIRFRLPLRQTEGFLGSLLSMISPAKKLKVPDYSTISRRSSTLPKPRNISNSRVPTENLKISNSKLNIKSIC